MNTAVSTRRNPASLRKGFAWSFLGSFVSLLGSWGNMLILVHAGTAEMVGQYGLALAIVSPIMAFANLQLRGLQATDAGNQYAFGDYLGLRLCSIVFVIISLSVVLTVSPQSSGLQAVTIFVALKLILNAVSDVFYGMFQQQEALDKVAQATMWNNLLTLAFFAGTMAVTGSLIMAAASSALAAMILLVFHNLPTAVQLGAVGVELRPRWEKTALLGLLLQALPLAIVSFLVSINTQLPRYFIVNIWDEKALGVFVALASLLVALNTFTAAVAQTVSPRLARYFVQRNRARFIRLLLQLEAASFGIGLLAVAAAYYVGPAVVSWVYQPVYGEERGAITWLAVTAGLGMMSRFLGNAMTAARKLYMQLLNNGLGVATLAIACYVWVPENGLEGAFMAMAVAATVRLLLNVLVLARVCASGFER